MAPARRRTRRVGYLQVGASCTNLPVLSSCAPSNEHENKHIALTCINTICSGGH